MTELTGNIHGTKATLTQLPAHYLLSALDDYLIAEYPDKVLGATIQLGIGVETFIKSRLEKIDPSFIKHDMDWKRWKRFQKKHLHLSQRERKALLLKKFKDSKSLANDKTITLARAIQIYELIKPISKCQLDDLTELREYRNGLFHWKAENKNTFELSKLCLRIFLWIYELIETENQNHMLSDEVIVFDPMLDKYQMLLRLKEYADNNNEHAFNFERRRHKHHKQYTLTHQSEARLKGHVIRKDAISWDHNCPACNYGQMQLSEIGLMRDGIRENRDVLANCKRCNFSATGKEQEQMIPAGAPTLLEIYDALSIP